MLWEQGFSTYTSLPAWQPRCLQGVVVVRRRDRDGIDGLVFQQLAQIRVRGGPLLSGLLDFAQRALSTDSSMSQMAAISTFFIAL